MTIGNCLTSEDYRKYLTECIKTAARMIENNAEDIAGKTDYISNLSITVYFDQEMWSVPEIVISRSHVPEPKEIERLCDYKCNLMKKEE